MLIRRGRRVADYLGAPCTAVYLEKDAPVLEDHLTFCRNLRIEAAAVGGPDQLTAVAKYAREHGITHVYLTRHTPDLKGFVKQMPDLHLIIVAERGETATISS
jgi:K+-sensing histidine kinase KdpD